MRACVPTSVWEQLRLVYFASARRNSRLYRELGPVLRRLHGSGIPVIVLKGAFLAEVVYGDVALRPMCDVDLMVPRAEVPRTQAVLLDMGGIPEHAGDHEWWYRRECHLPAIVIDTLPIEVHWSILPPGTVSPDTAGLWHRARPASVAGVEALVLSPEDLLLHLCLHSSYRENLRGGLRPLSDIVETIRRCGDGIDWALVVRLAHEWGATRYVDLALSLARSMLAAAVPDEILERLAPDGSDRRILQTARESILAQVDYSPRAPFFDALGARSFGDMVRLTWKRVFLSRDEMAAKYPASRNSRCICLYYGLRLRDAIRALGAYAERRGLPAIRSRGRARRASLANWLRSEKP
jgi:hypothetical protein